MITINFTKITPSIEKLKFNTIGYAHSLSLSLSHKVSCEQNQLIV